MKLAGETKLRARPDLSISQIEGQGPHRYVVKDPVSLEYFHLGAREAFVLEQLAAPKSIDNLQRAYNLAFAPEKISAAAMLRLCSQLHDSSLLLPEGPGSGAPLRKPRPRARDSRGWSFSPLVIRLPGFDPTPLLRVLAPIGAIAFSWAGLAAWLAVALLVGVGVFGRQEALVQEGARLLDLFDPRYAAAAVLAVALAKSWHEIGHGLACRRMGGECHEMGVMLLALAPCLYCDVSDAWSFRSRWRRAVVTLGGVYFELMLATAALAAWLVLTPGFARTLALYVAAVASLSTLLINLNPLMRFDGYYLLSDLWGVPNLHQQARQALLRPLTRWVALDRSAQQPLDAPRGLLAAFALASLVQIVFILCLILWTLHRTLDGWSLRPLGDLLVFGTLAGIGVALVKSLRACFPAVPDGKWPIRVVRLAAALSLVAAGAWWAAGWRMEQTLWAPCRFELASATNLAAPESGRLTPCVAYGQHVRKGDVLARLSNPELELRRLELHGEAAETRARIDGLRPVAQRDAELLSEIALLEIRLHELTRQQATLAREQQALTVASPCDGVVMRPPPRPAPQERDELPGWTGATLDPENAGCWVERGDLLCSIGSGHVQAVLLLDETDSGLVAPQDAVRILADRLPGGTIAGSVAEIGLAAADEDRSRPTASSDVSGEQGLRGALNNDRSYRVLASASGVGPGVQHGALGQARIVTGQETLGQMGLRKLRGMFRFER
ncbi:Peptidase family M50 [Pirellulimonas nuda]|uniref:Peptidase family M50 n=1 Tax=Pirellulimonas nuda TaxID=2528009 RepID=A0A518DAH3_9BACT|nr:hypothetical protein [Pirellulimonas nuda]QDU88485.1 Peptidase family M50 [Pirellulimonas nuda]